MKNTSILMSLVLLLAGCHRTAGEQTAGTDKCLPVEVMVVGGEGGRASYTYVGEIRPLAEIPLYNSIGGVVDRVLVKSGDRVRKGQVVVEWDKTQAAALYESAKATLQQAEDGYQRLEPLHEQGLIAEVKWVEMLTNRTKAQQNERAAAKALSDCQTVAPMDGVVGTVDVHEGQHLMPGQAICTLYDVTAYYADYAVPEKEINQVNVADTVWVTVEALQTELPARVVSREMVANRLTHSYTVRASMQRQLPEMRAGMVCKVRSHGAAVATGGSRVIVPARCVQTTPDGAQVWVVRDGGAYRQAVHVSGYEQEGVAIDAGLQVGDSVIVAGYQKLWRGARVRSAYQ